MLTPDDQCGIIRSMPGVKGKSGNPRGGPGRRALPIEQRAVVNGKIVLRVTEASVPRLKRLMRRWPHYDSVDELVEHLIERADETLGSGEEPPSS